VEREGFEPAVHRLKPLLSKHS